MQKTKRLLEIEKIVAEANISTQEELLEELKGKGINCTQATLSRNLRQLGVGRIPNGAGGYKYSLPTNTMNSSISAVNLSIVPAVLDIIEAKGLIVIKTIPGNASNTASYIDGSGRYEIAGTIAGDDTILLIPRERITLQQVHTCLEIILPGIHDKIRKKG